MHLRSCAEKRCFDFRELRSSNPHLEARRCQPAGRLWEMKAGGLQGGQGVWGCSHMLSRPPDLRRLRAGVGSPLPSPSPCSPLPGACPQPCPCQQHPAHAQRLRGLRPAARAGAGHRSAPLPHCTFAFRNGHSSKLQTRASAEPRSALIFSHQFEH